jgi:ABC-2 type transport system ATP-binding protein
MQQRLGLAQALLHRPRLLVLDEPTDGLDPRARADIRAVIRNLQKQGVTVFLNSHILQEVELVCDRVAILDRGALRYCGPVDQIDEFVKQTAGSRPGWLVQWHLAGPQSDIQACFGAAAQPEWQAAGENLWTVRTRVESQDEVDRVIDALRARGVRISGLVRQQATLEEAFLQIVDQSGNAANELRGDAR